MTASGARAAARRRIPRLARAALGLVALAALGASAATAQPAAEAPAAIAAPAAPAAAAKPAPPQPIALPEVAVQADQVSGQLRDIQSSLARDPRIEKIAADLPGRSEGLKREAEDVQHALATGPSLRALNDLEESWSDYAGQLKAWTTLLTQRATDLQAQLASLDRMAEVWKVTEAESRHSHAPPAVRDRIRTTLDAIAATRRDVQGRANEIYTLQDSVGNARSDVDAIVDQIQDALGRQRGHLFEPEQPPLWAVGAQLRATSQFLAAVAHGLERDAQRLRAFARDQRGHLLLHGLLFCALLPVTFFLRKRARRRRAQARSLGPQDAVFERPISIALLVTLPLLLFLYGGGARPVVRILGVLLWIPALRVLQMLVPLGLQRPIFALAGFYVADRIRDFFDTAPLLERFLFALEMAVGLGLVIWLLRPRRLQALGPGQALPRGLGVALRVAAGVFGFSLAANALGFLALGRLVGEGVLGSAYAAVIWFAVARVLQLLSEAALATGAAKRTRLVQVRGDAIRRRVDRLVGAAGLLLWGWVTLRMFGLGDLLGSSSRWLLASRLHVGSVTLSLGDVLAFGVTVWLALWASRMLRALLEDEVLPRAHLARGVPHSIAALAQYTVLLIGFLLAVAAAGFDWSRVTLLAGAFGVGVGFGLQNIVNNFVSGLILLFERPIQVGDTVQQGDLFGEVRRIGIRSSTVRTWQGAEVIVPNANLISEQVVNWTLSDRNRRIDLKVGVAYGTDPERVLELLRRVAEQHPDVLREPPPLALFTDFGDSSLDFELRVWTTQPDRIFAIRSAVAVAIHGALRDAGITIPFPQRDLHLVSVDEAAAGRLAGRGAMDGRRDASRPAEGADS
jgi:potassium efflux system protein